MAVYLDSLKKRVQIFTEGIVEALCAFILAVIILEPKKDDNQSTGNAKEDSLENVLARGIISPLAVVNIDAGIIIYSILLLLPEIWWTDLLLPCIPRSDLLFLMYKGSVHLLGLLLMAFASVLLLMDNIGKHLWCLLVLIPLGLFILVHGYCSWQNGQGKDAELYKNCGDRLEASVDFSACVTFLLFLEFQGLVLAGPHEGLSTPLVTISFLFCIAAVFFMTLDTVPLLISENIESDGMCHLLEICNWILAIFLAVVVMLITFETLGPAGLAVLAIPTEVSLFAWSWITFSLSEAAATTQAGGGGNAAAAEVKPASLDLTKVIFSGFLAISAAVHALSSKEPISIDRRLFLLLAATGVNTCLLWRLLTHVKTPSPVIAKVSAFASVCARVLIAAAVVPFAVIAGGVLKAKYPMQ